MIRFGTFCSGIGAPEVAFTPLGWQCAFQSEIDPACSRLLASKYNAPNLGDICNVTAEQLPKVDVWVAGTPCQDFSVAGKRAGFEGERGKLTNTILSLLDTDSRPKWFLFENVPGIIQGDCAEGFRRFLDRLESIGYIIDVDILDAQYFGLAQRRRRVFICAQHRDALLKSKTANSALTIAQCLTECLLLGLVVLSKRSLTEATTPARTGRDGGRRWL